MKYKSSADKDFRCIEVIIENGYVGKLSLDQDSHLSEPIDRSRILGCHANGKCRVVCPRCNVSDRSIEGEGGAAENRGVSLHYERATFSEYDYISVGLVCSGPESRRLEAVGNQNDLVFRLGLYGKILSESDEAGVFMVSARGGREIFITGHMEYSPDTLDKEYKRDLEKGLPIEKPRHYYRNDDPAQKPLDRWRAHANLFYANWLNYYVYQDTPYNLQDIQ